jgi:metal-responsive CopG/Arc/MetJ family transcriptional regulator
MTELIDHPMFGLTTPPSTCIHPYKNHVGVITGYIPQTIIEEIADYIDRGILVSRSETIRKAVDWWILDKRPYYHDTLLGTQKNITFALTFAQLYYLKKCVERTGLSRSELVRVALIGYLEQELPKMAKKMGLL